MSGLATTTQVQTQREFDPTAARQRLKELWKLPAQFGEERKVTDFYLNELVSDRYVLVKGLQLLRDELQLAGTAKTDMVPSLFPLLSLFDLDLISARSPFRQPVESTSVYRACARH